MAAAPYLRKPFGLDSHGSGGPHDGYSSPQLRSVSSSCESSSEIFSPGYLLSHRAARVYPCDDEEALLELNSASLGTSTPLLRCSIQPSERRVFLCFKEPRSWPAVVEGADADRLLRFLAAAVKLRKNEMMKKTWLIVCEGRDGTDFPNGDVLIFPDMVLYRGLTHFDVDAFVDEVLVKNQDWVPGRPEKLLGTYAFVCAHGNREANFGILGPEIIERFKHEIAVRGLNNTLHVRPCSYIGGRKFTKNLIVYSSEGVGVSGRCYGCVTPDNVADVLDDFHDQGYISYGQCKRQTDLETGECCSSLSQECSCDSLASQDSDQFKHQQVSQQIYRQHQSEVDGTAHSHAGKIILKSQSSMRQKRRSSWSSTWWQASWWFCFWEKEDTLATLAIVGAAASVLVAYHAYRYHNTP